MRYQMKALAILHRLIPVIRGLETRPSRPIRCGVWIVEQMRYPTNRPTNQPTDGHSQLLRCLVAPNNRLHIRYCVVHLDPIRLLFLVADRQLYNRLCPSVGPSVRWYVDPSVSVPVRGEQVEKCENAHFR